MILNKLLTFFNTPYPFYENWKQGLKICFGLGIFIGLFCYLFRPLGLDRLNSISLLGFGLVTFLVCFFYMIILPLFFSNWLTTKNWKIYKEIIWVLLINISIALSNYFYLGYVFDAGYLFVWNIFFFVLFWTVVIAIIPAVAIILYKQLFVYKKIVKEVEKIDNKLVKNGNPLIEDREEKIALNSNNKNESFELYSNNFLLLSASGNYLEIFFIENGEVHKKLIRNKISNIESDFANIPNLIRCHRSFLVNLNKVVNISGNLQGYQLAIKHIDFTIPVSRSYTKMIKNLLVK